jgi:hypothetical protein
VGRIHKLNLEQHAGTYFADSANSTSGPIGAAGRVDRPTGTSFVSGNSEQCVVEFSHATTLSLL